MVETGHFATPVAADGGALGHRRRLHARRLAPRRRSRRDRGQAGAGHGARHQGGDASCTTRPRPASPAGSATSAPRSTRVGHPALLHGRHDLLARLDRLPPRRVEGRRHRQLARKRASCCRRGSASTRSREGAARPRKTNKMPRSYWDWEEMLEAECRPASFPIRRPPTCCTACAKPSRCCSRKGSTTVFARHERLAAATRAAVTRWGLEVLCLEPERIFAGADRPC